MGKIVKDFIAVENDDGGLGLIIAKDLPDTVYNVPLLAQSFGIPFIPATTIITVNTYYGSGIVFYSNGYIWSEGANRNTLLKVNPTTNIVVDTISISNQASSYIFFDKEHLWVPLLTNHMIQVDVNKKVILNTITITKTGAGCFDGTYMWIVTSATTIAKVNTITAAVIFTVTVGNGVYGLCYDGENIWASLAVMTSGSIVKVNASNYNVLLTITLGTNPYFSCYDGTYIWASCSTPGTVTKINPRATTVSNSLLLTITTGGSPNKIVFDGSYLWAVLYSAKSVCKIDPKASTSAAAMIYTVSITTGSPYCITFDGTYLWIGCSNSGPIKIHKNRM